MNEVPRIVGQRLRAVAQSADHPDANLLSAFAERSLGKGAQDAVLVHLSRCASCRDVVSLSAPVPGNATAVPEVSFRPDWLSWTGLRWGAAVACVMLVGVMVTLHQKREARPIAVTIADGKPGASAQMPGSSSTVEKKVVSVQVGKGVKSASNPVEMAEAKAGSPFAELVPGRAKDASSEKASEKSLAAPTSMMSRAMSDEPIPANVVPRWTLSSDGTLQRSLDSGASWQTIPVSSLTVFRALAANGFDIWVGGLAGSLFHSSDAGEHWTQVQPAAEGEILADDIIGVEFTDTLHGKLTTSNQEVWITIDAGHTWQK